MATISEPNRLYLYRLFSTEVGLNKQTTLARMEEVLADDNILPGDLGCSDMRELLESLGGFVHLTVFKRGRVYATVLPQPAWDELLARLDAQPADKQPARGKKTWKKRRGGKDLQPMKPRPKNRPKPVEEVVEQADTPEPEATAQPAPEPETMAVVVPEPEPEAQPEAVPEPESEPEAQPETEPEAEPTAKAVPEPEAQPEPESEQESKYKPKPAPRAVPSINISVVYDPSGDEPDAPKAETQPVEPNDTPEPASPLLPLSRRERLPMSFRHEVAYSYEQLALLYQIVPLDEDPLALVDEDWHVARSTESFSRSGSSLTFELRIDAPTTNKPLSVTIRQDSRTASGKAWSLMSLNGISPKLEDYGPDGLPTNDEGSWRALAQFAHLGPEHNLLLGLAELAEPEPWGDGLAALRTYLSLAYRRAAREGGIRLNQDATRAEFDTGLLSRREVPIVMRFVAQSDDIFWRFVGFAEEL